MTISYIDNQDLFPPGQELPVDPHYLKDVTPPPKTANLSEGTSLFSGILPKAISLISVAALTLSLTITKLGPDTQNTAPHKGGLTVVAKNVFSDTGHLGKKAPSYHEDSAPNGIHSQIKAELKTIQLPLDNASDIRSARQDTLSGWTAVVNKPSTTIATDWTATVYYGDTQPPPITEGWGAAVKPAATEPSKSTYAQNDREALNQLLTKLSNCDTHSRKSCFVPTTYDISH